MEQNQTGEFNQFNTPSSTNSSSVDESVLELDRRRGTIQQYKNVLYRYALENKRLRERVCVVIILVKLFIFL